MQSFLAKCAAIGIIAGGFAVTGDLSRLADRGRRLIDATGVPTDRSAAPETLPPLPAGAASSAAAPSASGAPSRPTPTPQPAASTPPNNAAASAVPVEKPWRLPGDAPADAPVGLPVSMPKPVSGGVDHVDLPRLPAGSRILVWVPQPGEAGRGPGGTDLIALDIIDPAAGEALEHRHAGVTAGSRGPIHAAPRRVRIVADAAGRVIRGDVLRLEPLRGVNGTGRREELGRVLALDVKEP